MVDLETYMSPDIDAINDTIYEINKEIDSNDKEKKPDIFDLNSMDDDAIRDLGNNY